MTEADSDVGDRDDQEDLALALRRSDAVLLAVCDAGGGGGGTARPAAELAITRLRDAFTAGLALDGVRGVLEAVHRELQELGAADRKAVAEGTYVSTAWRYIETTADVVMFEQGRAQLCHVGNGRIYRIRDGNLERVMDAQNGPEHWKRMNPELTDEQLANLPPRVLLRALGFVGALLPDEATLPTAPGDVFLIASDGLFDLLPDEAIADVLRRGLLARALIEAAITVEPPQFGRDNMAAAVHVVGTDGL